MHTVWKGYISFGLVNIPVKMFAATEEKDVRFRLLHSTCKTPIEYVRRCPHCRRDVGREEIVHGYEYGPGQFVILKEEDLEAVPADGRRSIEIMDFVELQEIDPVYYDKSYYLSPGENGEKAYALLKKAMEATGKIAVARLSLRKKPVLAAVRVYGEALMLETLFYPDEVRSTAAVPGLPAEAELHEKEVRMAVQLIENLAAPFEPQKYTDTYRHALHDLIARKIEDREVAPAPRPANVVDLMEALQESLKAVSGEKKGAAGKRRKATG